MQQRQPVVSTIPTFPAPERRVMLLLVDFSLFWLRTKLTGNSRNKHNIWRRCKMLNSTCRSFSFFSAASLSLFFSRLFNLSGTRSPCHIRICKNHYQTCSENISHLCIFFTFHLLTFPGLRMSIICPASCSLTWENTYILRWSG